MLAYIKGPVFHKSKNRCIILHQSLGYEIEVSHRNIGDLEPMQEAEFYLYTYVREDQISLFGFADLSERELFMLLIAISGIGPKAALSILASGSVEQIHTAIATANVSFFTKVKGLGKKRSQKLIIELKGKLGSLHDLDLADDTSSASEDVVSALKQLGFKHRDIVTVLEKLEPNLSEDDQIKQALGLLGKG